MIVFQNRTIEEDYETNNAIAILQTNAENIVRNIDMSAFNEKDLFFLCKNPATQIFSAFTGTMGEQCKYIDKNGETVTNTGTFAGTVYTRIFSVEREDDSIGKPRQVIK